MDYCVESILVEGSVRIPVLNEETWQFGGGNRTHTIPQFERVTHDRT